MDCDRFRLKSIALILSHVAFASLGDVVYAFRFFERSYWWPRRSLPRGMGPTKPLRVPRTLDQYTPPTPFVFERLFSHVFESSMYDEHRPIRRRRQAPPMSPSSSSSVDDHDDEHLSSWSSSTCTDWGISILSSDDIHDPGRHAQRLIKKLEKGEIYSNRCTTFPSTVEEVTDAILEAIRYALTTNDPVIHGGGRIGIEIDGAEYLHWKRPAAVNAKLRNDDRLTDNSKHGKIPEPTMSSHCALRKVAINLARKLACAEFGPNGMDDKPLKADKEFLLGRPVLLYLNQINQALYASQELQFLKNAEHRSSAHGKTATSYDSVTILCLSQHSNLPTKMLSASTTQLRSRGKGTGSKRSGILGTEVRPEHGVLLFVQPTDYNSEYEPPGPSFGTVEALQRLVAQASVRKMLTIVLSPRFLSADNPHTEATSRSASTLSTPTASDHHPFVHDGSIRSPQRPIRYAQSTTYGGWEPPRGPTPWIMRDFTPPIFCWVGNALSLLQHDDHNDGDHHQHHGNNHDGCRIPPTGIFRDEQGYAARYTHMALLQSIRNQHQAWHMFVSKDRLSDADSILVDSGWQHQQQQQQQQPRRNRCWERDGASDSTVAGSRSRHYQYLASTQYQAGRPTRKVLRFVFDEFASYG